MALEISGSSSVSPSPAPPREPSVSSVSQPGNARSDEAASRRAEDQANVERARAKETQVAEEVRENETVTQQAQESTGGIDLFA